VVANTAQKTAGNGYTGTHLVGDKIPVKWKNGIAFVEIRDVSPSKVIILCVIILCNRPKL